MGGQCLGHPAVRVGDRYPVHSCGDSSHDGAAAKGSPTVIVEGVSVHRIGDAISCGDISASGSPNVIAGDGPFPIFLAKEPGVFIVQGAPVYDNTSPGQKAIIRDTTYLPGDPAVTQDSPVTPAPTPKFQSCDQFPAIITVKDMAAKISKYFTLSTCQNLPVEQRGLTANQIACNWAALCTMVLDPINEHFKISFNSGFRTVASGMGNTDHGLGCAADISAGSTENTIAMFKWIQASGLPFSQLIYEKHNSAWCHVSYRGKEQGAETRIMMTLTGAAPYTHYSQIPPAYRP